MRARVIIAAVVLLASSWSAFADWDSGVAAFRSGDYQTAFEEFTAVVDRNPRFAGGFYMLGLTLQRLHRTDEAVEALKEANVLEPANPQYAVARARSLQDAHRPQDAQEVLDRLDLDELQPEQRQLVLVAKAVVAQAVGDQERALGLFAQAADENPENTDVSAQFAHALARAGREREAFEVFRRIWEIAGSEAAGRNAIVAGLRAARAAATKSERVDLFRHVAELAAARYERSPGGDLALLAGEAFLGAGEYRSALTWFDRVGEDTALVLLYKGQVHASLGQLEPAERSLRAAAKLQPDAGLAQEIWGSLGLVLDMARKYGEAARVYQQAGNTVKAGEMREKERLAQQNVAADEEERRIRELQRLIREFAEIDRRGPAPTPPPQ